MNSLVTLNNSDNGLQKFICFSLGNNKYAVTVENVLEVMDLPHLDYPQKLPANIIGLLKFNNLSVNVLDVRFYIDIPIEKYTINNKLILIKTDETIFALVVDSIENIIDIGIDKIERLSYSSKNKVIELNYNYNNENYSIINVSALENILKEGCEEKEIDVKTLFPVDNASNEVFYQRSIELSQKYDFAITQNIYSDDRFLSLSLNNSTYYINLCYVKSISEITNLTNLPCSKNYIEGLMTYRGDFITIINTKAFLNLSNSTYDKKKAKVIVIDSNDLKLGFLVEEVYDIIYIPEDQIQRKSSSKNNDEKYIFAEIIEDNNIKFILNMDKILNDEKMYIDEN